MSFYGESYPFIARFRLGMDNNYGFDKLYKYFGPNSRDNGDDLTETNEVRWIKTYLSNKDWTNSFSNHIKSRDELIYVYGFIIYKYEIAPNKGEYDNIHLTFNIIRTSNLSTVDSYSNKTSITMEKWFKWFTS